MIINMVYIDAQIDYVEFFRFSAIVVINTFISLVGNVLNHVLIS